MIASSLAAAALAGSTMMTGRPAAAQFDAVPVAPQLAIQPRVAWAGTDRPPLGPLNDEDVRFLLVHHTASANGADPIAVMRSAYDFHTGPDKAWPDVAYNFFIDQGGVVYEARAGSLERAVEASATGGSQGFAQLVCLLGDFTSVLPTEAARASLVRVLAWLADRYAIDTALDATTSFASRGSNRWPAGTDVTTTTIAGHRDMSQTACPGDTFYPYLIDTTRPQVAAARTAPSTTSTSTTSTTTPLPAVPNSTTTTSPAATTVQPRSSIGSAAEPPTSPAVSTSADTISGAADSGGGSLSSRPRDSEQSLAVPLTWVGGAAVVLAASVKFRQHRMRPVAAIDNDRAGDRRRRR